MTIELVPVDDAATRDAARDLIAITTLSDTSMQSIVAASIRRCRSSTFKVMRSGERSRASRSSTARSPRGIGRGPLTIAHSELELAFDDPRVKVGAPIHVRHGADVVADTAPVHRGSGRTRARTRGGL